MLTLKHYNAFVNKMHQMLIFPGVIRYNVFIDLILSSKFKLLKSILKRKLKTKGEIIICYER
jgi:hypothetical protein